MTNLELEPFWTIGKGIVKVKGDCACVHGAPWVGQFAGKVRQLVRVRHILQRLCRFCNNSRG